MRLFDELLAQNAANSSFLVQFGDLKVSYEDLEMKILACEKILRKCGVCENAKVVVLVEDPFSFVVELFAVDRIGAVSMPLYGQTGVDKMKAIMARYNPNFIVSSKSQDWCEELQKKQNDDLGVFVYCYSSEIDEELSNIALILFTSGTTNLPKAIALSYDNILSNVRAISQYLKLNQNDKMLLVKNMSHSSSIVGELFVGLYNGCQIMLFKGLPTAEHILKMVDEEKISVFFAVPSILQGMLCSRKLANYDTTSLRIINFYGASMSEKNIADLVEKFPNANIIYSYGLTEASPRVTYIEKKDILRKLGSSGKPIQDVQVRIADDEGCTVESNVRGEIVVKGPNVMQGYYSNKEYTQVKIKNGELFSGDIGYLDEDGFLFVTGRKDNMIIYSGKNIYPEEIEKVLTSYEGIQEAVAVLAEEANVSYIKAYMVATKEIDVNGLKEFCKSKLEDYKVPRVFRFVEAFHKTASGKIMRKIEGLQEK